MAGWIDVEDSLPSHRKTLEVADDLGIEPVQLVGHLTCLWLWATNNADNDGRLPAGTRAKTIARAALWSGDAEVFVAALTGRFVDRDGDCLTIHGWHEHFGKWAGRREKDAERKREERAADSQRGAADGRRTSNGHTTDVLRLAQAQTGPDLTGPDLSTDTECPVDSDARGERAPDVAPPRRAAEEETTTPTVLHADGQVCPGCRLPFVGSYGDHLESSPGHKIRPVPEDFKGKRRSSGRAVPEELPPEVAERLAAPPLVATSAPEDLLAEHERLLARERSIRKVANAPPAEVAEPVLAVPASAELAVQARGSSP